MQRMRAPPHPNLKLTISPSRRRDGETLRCHLAELRSFRQVCLCPCRQQHRLECPTSEKTALLLELLG